ncbi:hypothetical protein EVAR_70498_1 [Eumeta japonica]|uniref:Uncharacterized protein n=1 Tax=Eumeta variegata TaxID=151549 RepID=A0A4C2A6F6_EUMVA|nr:hypothetical protein EVAR_70498_1 [Eumeta japonica]
MGSSKAVHLESLDLEFKRLFKAGLKEENLKEEKCKLFEDSIEYLGLVIDKSRLNKSQTKAEAIENVASFKTVTALKSFLGQVTYNPKGYNPFRTPHSPLSSTSAPSLNTPSHRLSSSSLLVNFVPFPSGMPHHPQSISVVGGSRILKMASFESALEENIFGLADFSNLIEPLRYREAVSCNKSETIEKCVSDILQQYPDTTHYVFLIFSAVRTLVGCNSLSMPLKRSAGQSGEYANTCGVTLVTVAVCVVVTAAALAAFLARRRRCGRAPEAVVIYNKQDDEATK